MAFAEKFDHTLGFNDVVSCEVFEQRLRIIVKLRGFFAFDWVGEISGNLPRISQVLKKVPINRIKQIFNRGRKDLSNGTYEV